MVPPLGRGPGQGRGNRVARWIVSSITLRYAPSHDRAYSLMDAPSRFGLSIPDRHQDFEHVGGGNAGDGDGAQLGKCVGAEARPPLTLALRTLPGSRVNLDHTFTRLLKARHAAFSGVDSLPVVPRVGESLLTRPREADQRVWSETGVDRVALDAQPLRPTLRDLSGRALSNKQPQAVAAPPVPVTTRRFHICDEGCAQVPRALLLPTYCPTFHAQTYATD